jgi:hypothetical protein
LWWGNLRSNSSQIHGQASTSKTTSRPLSFHSRCRFQTQPRPSHFQSRETAILQNHPSQTLVPIPRGKKTSPNLTRHQAMSAPRRLSQTGHKPPLSPSSPRRPSFSTPRDSSPLAGAQDSSAPGSPHPQDASRSSTPRAAGTSALAPIPDTQGEADLPLPMAASVILTSLPRDAKNALEVANLEGPVKGWWTG